MPSIRIVAIPTELAEAVRANLKAPVYGFPAHAELATDDAPCRHCLRTFSVGKDRRILFTYDRFSGVEKLPQPGPVYIHADSCPRYDENTGFPEELRGSPRTLEAHAHGRRLVAQEYVADGKFEPAIEKLFSHSEVNYLRSTAPPRAVLLFALNVRLFNNSGQPRRALQTSDLGSRL